MSRSRVRALTAAVAFRPVKADHSSMPVLEHVPRSMTVHVECDRTGRWAVRPETDVRPVSLHGSATEAEHAAYALAETGAEIVLVLHDRYCRVRQYGRGRFTR